ncbi:MAG: hypothetical protein AAF412_11275, partial [Pseudomonadota bacterium]
AAQSDHRLIEQVQCLSTDEAIQTLTGDGLSVARVNPGSEMLAMYEDSYQFARSPNGDLVKGFPFQFKHSPMTISRNSPEVGEHTSHFLEGEIEEFEKDSAS